MARTRRPPRRIAAILSVVAAAGITASCSSGRRSSTTATTIPHPNYTLAQQQAYFADLRKNVPSVTTYVNNHGDTALAALLTYGSGFCEFLQAGQDPATALSSLQSQAKDLESKTGFTGSQDVFEAVATDALLTLCPSQQSALSPTELAQLKQVQQNLGDS